MKCLPSAPALGFALLLSGIAAPGLLAQGVEPTKSEQELRAFYLRSCSRCHGVDGSARASDGRKLKGRDFTSERGLRGESNEALVKTIRRGIYFGLAMPSFKKELSDEEALILVRDILRKVRKGEPVLPGANPILASRPETSASAGSR